MSPSFRADVVLRLALLVVWTCAAGCAGSSAARTLLREADPVVQAHEQIRRELAERGGAGRGLAPAGGCPVCQW